jgi:hypothetical protein
MHSVPIPYDILSVNFDLALRARPTMTGLFKNWAMCAARCRLAPPVETTGLAELVCVCKTTEPQAKPIEGGLIDVNQRFILK